MSDVQLEPAVADAPRTRARDPWLRFACPHCGKRNKIDSMSAGRCAACARCGQLVRIETAVEAPAKPTPPVMKSIDPPPAPEPSPVPEPSPLRQLSSHVAARDEAARAIAAKPRPPRPPLRLPTWAIVAMHVGLTLGAIAAVWILHERGYLPGFDPPTTHTTVIVVPPAPR